MWQWSIWVIVELGVTAGMIILTYYSRHIFPIRVRNLSLVLLSLGTLYAFLNALEIGTTTLTLKYLYYQLQYITLAVTVTFWLAFILKYISENYRFRPPAIALLSILPVLVTILALTNNLLHLFWTGSSPSGNAFLFFYNETPLYWISEIAIFAVFLYGVFLAGRQLQHMAEPVRGDALGVLFAALVVFIAAILEAFSIDRTTQFPISALSLGFAIAFSFIVFGFRYLRTVHIRPMAEQAAIEGLTDAFIAIDRENRVFYLNAAAQKLTGYASSDAYHRPLKELLPSWPQQIVNPGRKPSSLSREISIEKKGQYFWYEIGLSPINDAVGHFMGKVLLIHDVTDRVRHDNERRDIEKRAQMASRLSTVGQMAAGICHEINNPLTAVIGYSDLLAKKELPEGMKQQLGYILEGGHRVAEIVKQLLAFARNMRPTRTLVDINDIVLQTLKLREHQQRVSNINVVTRLDPDLPFTYADPGQLQQVFLNIVLNAEIEMKTAHGLGTLLVKTEHFDDTIRISFKDDGPGIAPENLANIFDPFFTTRKIGEGTGLGLSVCHGIVTEHHGLIYAQSELGEGATFIVELPVISEPSAVEMPGEAGKETRRASAFPLSILIIDDDPLLLRFLEEFLTGKGHYVAAIDNGIDAQKIFKNKKFDLILMDILMPDISGIELYNKFKEIDESVANRVLIMTGDTLGKPTRTFLHNTGVPYIEKPFDTVDIITKIDEIVSQNR